MNKVKKKKDKLLASTCILAAGDLIAPIKTMYGPAPLFIFYFLGLALLSPVLLVLRKKTIYPRCFALFNPLKEPCRPWFIYPTTTANQVPPERAPYKVIKKR